MVQATQWVVDSSLQPTNPYQQINYYPAWPGGMRAFGKHPVPLTITPVGSPNGFSPHGGLSGSIQLWGGRLRGGVFPSAGSVARGAVALGAILFGAWLAKKNLTER
ncbi:MAG TPA: hypothetical protein VF183_05610 [Acidimicrobiales bacterium]